MFRIPFTKRFTDRSTEQQAGFTLLEVMVVLTIIGLMLAMVNLGGGNRKAQTDTENFVKQLRGAMTSLRHDAVFQNLDLALGVVDKDFIILAYQSLDSQEFSAGLSAEEQSQRKDNPWQPYEGNSGGVITVPESLEFGLKLQGEEVELDDLINDDDSLKPAILFLSADEYSEFELAFSHLADPNFVVILSGDGVNQPRIKAERFEAFE